MVSPPRLLAKEPWLYKLLEDIKPKVQLKDSFFGPSQSIFVGRAGYPNVFIGPSASVQGHVASPSEMFGMEYSKIIERSAMVLRTRTKKPVSQGRADRVIRDSQILTLAKRPADIEVSFSNAPKFSFSHDSMLSPSGPSADLRKLTLAENVKIRPRVEKLIDDELLASESLPRLYREFDVDRITNILSSGILGQRKSRRLVPTRWSITAVDDMLFKHLAEEVRSCPSVNDYMVFESEFLSNRFVVLIMPGEWEFENFEAWSPNSYWAQFTPENVIEEYEPYSGRTKYADLQGGGYYASRLGVAEGLKRMRRKGRVVVFREIYDGYSIPVGVWQVRENVRNALIGAPVRFATKEAALEYVDTRLSLGLEPFKRKSRILNQVRISDFL